MKQSKLFKIIKITAVLLLWTAVWQFAAFAVNKEILIPYPVTVLKTLCGLLKQPDFYKAVVFSLLRIIAGYTGGVLAGFFGALLAVHSKAFKAIFSPVLHLIRSVPVASFIILAMVLIKSAYLPIFISFLMVLPMIWSTVETALNEIDTKYTELARVYRLNAFKTLTEIKLPFIKPAFLSACASALGFAWKSGIAAEIICRPEISLGKLLQDSKMYVDTPEIFAVTAVVAILSLLLELLLKCIVGRNAHKYDKS